MIEEYVRCIHCKVVYRHRVSGSGCFDAYNDKDYCHDCKEVIVNALEKVGPRAESFWGPCNDITVDEIEKELGRRDAESGLTFRQVFPGYVDMEDPDNRYITGGIRINGKDFTYNYWTKRGEKEVKIKMERDLQTGQEFVWRDYRSRYR